MDERDEGEFEAEPATTTDTQPPGQMSGDGDRRRRRRGRRGGRRNRRDREGFAPEGAVAPELAHDAPEHEPAPIGEVEPSYAPIMQSHEPMEPPAEAQPQEHEPLPSAAAEISEPSISEPSRRRSTVREPAPTALSDEATAPSPSYQTPTSSPEPVVSSSAANDASDRPRRSGWWSKRALDKG
jgi:ribonuclease E